MVKKNCLVQCNYCDIILETVYLLFRGLAVTFRGGATVLKVGGLRSQKKILTPLPHFLASGGTKYCLDS